MSHNLQLCVHAYLIELLNPLVEPFWIVKLFKPVYWKARSKHNLQKIISPQFDCSGPEWKAEVEELV